MRPPFSGDCACVVSPRYSLLNTARMEVRSITKGANIEIPTETGGLQIVVGWLDSSSERAIDASALLLSGRKVRSDADFVFYNQPTSADGSVRHLGASVTESGVEERIAVDLESMSADVDAIAVAASLDRGSFGELSGLHLVALDDAGVPIARYDITDATVETAFVFGEVYRRGGIWKLRAVGQGWDSGLAGLATDFGVTVDDDSASPPAADEPVTPPDALPDGGPAPVLDDSTSILDEPTTALDDPVSVLDDSVSVLDDPTPVVDDVTGSHEASIDVLDEPAPVVEPDAVPVSGGVPGPTAGPKQAAARSKGVRTRQPRATRIVAPVPTLAAEQSWQAARLFSVAGVGAAEEQEKRATSALLATMFAVRPFARGIVARLGAPAGAVETFAEVQFLLDERVVIPDGVIRVARGSRLWTALLEVKTGTGQLRRDQVEKYLDVARERGFDAVVTLSNEIAPGAGEHPIGVDKRKLRKVGMFHLSWAEVLQEARMVLTHRGVETPLQALILSEFIRYLEHPRSGASGFDDMGAAWVPVREAAYAGTLRASDRKVPAVADAWLRLVRYLCLHLTAELGVTVTHTLPRKLAVDPAARQAAVVSKLAVDGVLEATLRIPGAVGLVTVAADVRLGQVRVSVQVPAPKEGSAQRRVSWLLRQLGDTAPDDLVVEVGFAGRAETTCERLVDARSKPAILIVDRALDITTFRLTRNSAMGTKRSGLKGAFVPSVLASLETFYGTVVQGLKPWPSPAPQLSEETVSEAAALDDELVS
ncbi:TerD family protein [Dactylosporangium sp. NBC_01737]|uniref:TerD family protein n=1 Tax=Dactylosporangium sp. NBC_01737 TaxID=2975959 RepID=UPI002E164C80|nr:TerD family protein [Dactylosporangium sp. NBC_01737]